MDLFACRLYERLLVAAGGVRPLARAMAPGDPDRIEQIRVTIYRDIHRYRVSLAAVREQIAIRRSGRRSTGLPWE